MKKKIKVTFNAPVTLGFVLMCLLVLGISIITGGISNRMYFMTYHSSLASPLTYLRFFTHVLGHSGWAHFIGNASYLLLLGPMLEEKYGSKNILMIILIVALTTSVVHYILFPNMALCGASGVVFAFILLTSFTSFRQGEIPLTFILVAIIFLGQQVYDGLFVNDNISNLSHILGGVIGAVVGFAWNKNKRKR